jgi:hypothetical protein
MLPLLAVFLCATLLAFPIIRVTELVSCTLCPLILATLLFIVRVTLLLIGVVVAASFCKVLSSLVVASIGAIPIRHVKQNYY